MRDSLLFRENVRCVLFVKTCPRLKNCVHRVHAYFSTRLQKFNVTIFFFLLSTEDNCIFKFIITQQFSRQAKIFNYYLYCTLYGIKYYHYFERITILVGKIIKKDSLPSNKITIIALPRIKCLSLVCKQCTGHILCTICTGIMKFYLFFSTNDYWNIISCRISTNYKISHLEIRLCYRIEILKMAVISILFLWLGKFKFSPENTNIDLNKLKINVKIPKYNYY